MKTLNNVLTTADERFIILNIKDDEANTYNNLFISPVKWRSIKNLISNRLTDFMLLGSEITGVKLITPDDTYVTKEGEIKNYNSTKYIVDGVLNLNISYDDIKEKAETIKEYRRIDNLLDEILG